MLEKNLPNIQIVRIDKGLQNFLALVPLYSHNTFTIAVWAMSNSNISK